MNAPIGSDKEGESLIVFTAWSRAKTGWGTRGLLLDWLLPWYISVGYVLMTLAKRNKLNTVKLTGS